MNPRPPNPGRLTTLALLQTPLLLLLLIGCERPVSANATSGIVLNGTFTWIDGGDEPTSIQANFTPSQTPSTWDVLFTFRLNGSRHQWKGQMEQMEATDRTTSTLGGAAELADGPISGTITTGRGRNVRTFEISGEVSDGVLQATHAERDRRGRLEPSGRLLLNQSN